MTQTNFVTSVALVAPERGRCPAEWLIVHTCVNCRHRVANDDLVDHAQRHAADDLLSDHPLATSALDELGSRYRFGVGR